MVVPLALCAKLQSGSVVLNTTMTGLPKQAAANLVKLLVMGNKARSGEGL
jgi:hypothetical protein